MFHAWDYRVSLDFFFGGLGLGAFLLAAITYYVNRDRYSWTIKVASLLAPVLVGLGVLCLFTELGRPERAITTLWNLNPTSLISWGGWLQIIFIATAVLFYLQIKNEKFNQLTLILAGIGSGLALIVSTYHGYLLTSIGRDAWSGVLPLLFLLASVLSGFCMMFLLNLFFNKKRVEDTEAHLNLPIILVLLIVFTGFGVFSWIHGLYIGDAAKLTVFNLVMEDYAFLTIGGIFIAGLLVPALLFFFNSKHSDRSMGKISNIIGCILVIGGTFLLRHFILMLGQIVV